MIFRGFRVFEYVLWQKTKTRKCRKSKESFLNQKIRIFSILQFTRLLDSFGLCWFTAIPTYSIYILLMLIRFIFNSAASSSFQDCSNSAISLCNTCQSFTHLSQCHFQSSSMFMQLQLSPNSAVSLCLYIYIYIYIRFILFSIQV